MTPATIPGPAREHIGMAFGLWRRRARLSTREVARALNLTAAAVSLKETKGHALSAEQLMRLDTAYPGAMAKIVEYARSMVPASEPLVVVRRPVAPLDIPEDPEPPMLPAAPQRRLPPPEEPVRNEVQHIVSAFEGHDLTAIVYRDAPAFIAKEIGAVLGYGGDGRGLVDLIRSKWLDEFIVERDYHLIGGDELRLIKSALSNLSAQGRQVDPNSGSDAPRVDPNSATLGRRVDPRTPSLLLLTEAGVWLAIQKTEKPVGVRLRRHLADEVLPKLGRGQAIPAAATAPAVAADTALKLDAAREARMLIGGIRRKGAAAHLIEPLQLRAAQILLEVMGPLEPSWERPSAGPLAVTERAALATGGLEPAPARPAADQDDLSAFVREWWRMFGDGLVQPWQLLELAERHGLFRRRLAGLRGHSAVTVFGRHLFERVGTVVDGLEIQRKKSGNWCYHLVQP